MGTNFYHTLEVCETCDRPLEDPRHIGKASAGWVFAFRGYRGYIESFHDWRHVLTAGGRIEDEYGAEISYADFVSMVEARQTPDARRHSTMPPTDFSHYFTKDQWIDDEGYEFSDYEFS